jgi:hypothetical protein
MTNSTLTSLNLDNNPIGPLVGALLSEVLMTNSTLAIVKVDTCCNIDGEFDLLVKYFSPKLVAMIQRRVPQKLFETPFFPAKIRIESNRIL